MLKNQVQILEEREKEGVNLLKEADCMWLCMEDAYKKKVAESQERQQMLLKQVSSKVYILFSFCGNESDYCHPIATESLLRLNLEP